MYLSLFLSISRRTNSDYILLLAGFRHTVLPVAQCFDLFPDGLIAARFGFYNRNNFTVVIPLGEHNEIFAPTGISPNLVLRKGEEFEPGFHGFAVTVALETPSLVTWRLDGTIVDLDTSSSSLHCPSVIQVTLEFEGDPSPTAVLVCFSFKSHLP